MVAPQWDAPAANSSPPVRWTTPRHNIPQTRWEEGAPLSHHQRPPSFPVPPSPIFHVHWRRLARPIQSLHPSSPPPWCRPHHQRGRQPPPCCHIFHVPPDVSCACWAREIYSFTKILHQLYRPPGRVISKRYSSTTPFRHRTRFLEEKYHIMNRYPGGVQTPSFTSRRLWCWTQSPSSVVVAVTWLSLINPESPLFLIRRSSGREEGRGPSRPSAAGSLPRGILTQSMVRIHTPLPMEIAREYLCAPTMHPLIYL